MLTQTLLLSLPALALTLPTTTSNPPSIESWLIPRLDQHVMSQRTGLPGNNPWPESLRFNSTVDFDAILPIRSADGAATTETVTVNCKASFLNGTLPAEPVACTGAPAGEEVAFGMRPYVQEGKDVRVDLSYVLSMGRGGEGSTFISGEVAITANDGANTASSYLTCLEGAPLDGLRCKIGSFLSVRNDLVIVGKAV